MHPGHFLSWGATAMAAMTSDRIGDFGIEPLKLFQFMARFAARGSQRMVCIGLLTSVTEVLGQSEMDELFGGWIIYTTPEMDAYLGVWGERKVKKFRRILRERGASISLERSKPDAARMGSRRCVWPNGRGSRPEKRRMRLSNTVQG
jgi:hypothetical protein